jgi:hypothetical protein
MRQSGGRHLIRSNLKENVLPEGGIVAGLCGIEPFERDTGGLQLVVVAGEAIPIHLLAEGSGGLPPCIKRRRAAKEHRNE